MPTGCHRLLSACTCYVKLDAVMTYKETDLELDLRCLGAVEMEG